MKSKIPAGTATQKALLCDSLSYLGGPEDAGSAAASPNSTSKGRETLRYCGEKGATPELPDQFEGKLNLAGRGLCGGEKSRALNTLSTLIEDLKVVGWRGKIRAV